MNKLLNFVLTVETASIQDVIDELETSIEQLKMCKTFERVLDWNDAREMDNPDGTSYKVYQDATIVHQTEHEFDDPDGTKSKIVFIR